ncbi:MAG: hypothetical protein JNK64_33240 [Myxococcales bacterium]|nr:hypothetical protein [Myxococcales bacterium]
MRFLQAVCVSGLALVALGACKSKSKDDGKAAPPAPAPTPPPAPAATPDAAPAPAVDAAPAAAADAGPDPAAARTAALAAIDAALTPIEAVKKPRARGDALCADRALRALAAPLDPAAPPAGTDAEAWRDAVALLQERIDPVAACTEDDRADVGTYTVAELRAALTAVQKLAAP